MFLGHFAIGLAAKRAAPNVSLATWFAAVQFADLVWPVLLLAGLEHVRIAPGITPFTPLDFYDYPITHSLVGMAGWAILFAVVWLAARGTSRRRNATAAVLGLAVLSHWFLDALAHRPDMPVLPRGPLVGLGLWNSIPGTLIVESSMFAIGLAIYLRSAAHRPLALWSLIVVLLVAYAGAAFGPPPPDVQTLAITGLSMWLLVAWAWYADRADERLTTDD